MEDLREAQQRLETDKALFQQELSSQKENMEKERSELNAMKQALQKEQEDIAQQRDQLYRFVLSQRIRVQGCFIKALLLT
jgi:predicted  nucleic acid-binding Zn-ribbon protein